MEHQVYAEKAIDGSAKTHSTSSDAAMNEVLNELVKKHDFCNNSAGQGKAEAGKLGSSLKDLEPKGEHGTTDFNKSGGGNDVVTSRKNVEGVGKPHVEGEAIPKNGNDAQPEKTYKNPFHTQKPDVGGSTLEKEIMDRSKMLKSWTLKV